MVNIHAHVYNYITIYVYFHFNNLRFKQTQNATDSSAAHVLVSFVSSEIRKCRLSKCLLDHPMHVSNNSNTETYM